MKKSLILLFFSLLNVQLVAQDEVLRKLTQEVPDCEVLNHNAFKLIPAYYARQQPDSVLMVFERWDAHCPNYYVLSFKVLLAIEHDSLNTLNDLLGDLEFFNWYSGFHDLSGTDEEELSTESPYSSPYSYYQRLAAAQPQKGYWQLIAKRANAQANRLNKGTWAYMVASFLAHNEEPLFSALEQNDSHLPMQMRTSYKNEEEEQRKAGKVEAGVYLNYWVPQQNLSLVGNHPGAGFKVGYSQNGWRGMGTMHFNFLRSANPYTVQDGDSTLTTDHFLGVYVGAEFGRILYYSKHHELSVNLGLAYHGIEAAENTAGEGETSNALYLNSHDWSAGLEYRYFYNAHGYVGIQALYHVNAFDNKLNDQFFGNSYSLRLCWGFASRSDGRMGKANLGIR
jgi:hypothetical protein